MRFPNETGFLTTDPVFCKQVNEPYMPTFVPPKGMAGAQKERLSCEKEQSLLAPEGGGKGGWRWLGPKRSQIHKQHLNPSLVLEPELFSPALRRRD